MDNKVKLIQMAYFAQSTERFDDMASKLKSLIEQTDFLSNDERNMFSFVFQKLARNLRTSWHNICIIEKNTYNNNYKPNLVKEYRQVIEQNLVSLCNEALSLIEKLLVSKRNDCETDIFYYKMKGDYYRYISEVVTGEKFCISAAEAQKCYQKGFDIGVKNLEPTNEVFLELIIDFAIFYYDILNMPDVACQIAENAYNKALANIDNVNNITEDNILVLMILLDENIRYWKPNIKIKLTRG